ncbi:hypothetical protein M1L60_42580 [Actinoplanes sp. TRM 88003]|uniref:Uncharacterized protein n=1 Tax=Paractinoplanes aksuensis TaxID=2939490 RepID=A0ABT1E2C8_9ACTN|nr:hypothetical protein [Actinoplanes aksuensis]MCO8277284.1 hypothetical protein [Actinoplanes aksuensis]
MKFFEQFPPPERDEPEPEEQPPPSWAKPETVLGAAVPVEVVLARGGEAAVGLSRVTAYPNGFTFSITAVLRQEDRRGRVFRLGFHRELFEEPVSDEFFRVGVQFADGGVATNLGFPALPPDAEPAAPLLLQNGGGGGGRRYDMGFWVWPLPPPGPVTFVCEWPAYGIAETRIDMDAGPILDAAERAVPLWP